MYIRVLNKRKLFLLKSFITYSSKLSTLRFENIAYLYVYRTNNI